jgi:hypothetical protein
MALMDSGIGYAEENQHSHHELGNFVGASNRAVENIAQAHVGSRE